MKLNDLDTKKYAQRALNENYNIPFNIESLSASRAKTLLSKVRKLAMEAKRSPDFHNKQTSPSYMKLVFMEQTLSSHLRDLAQAPKPRIVFEDEEVDSAQVTLAAQDMVDSVQKMVVEISDMLYKELPALVSSIESDPTLGNEAGDRFDSQASETLSALLAAVQEAEKGLKAARNIVTGKESEPIEPVMGPEEPEMGMPMPGEEEIEVGAEEEIPAPPPVAPATGPAGRAKR